MPLRSTSLRANCSRSFVPGDATAAIELRGERLALARGTDVEAEHRREGDWQTKRAERRQRCAETMIHFVDVALVRGVEAADEQQRVVCRRRLSPPMKLALAVEGKIGGGERVGEAEADAGALRHVGLCRVEAEAKGRVARPRPLACISRREGPKLLREAVLRRRS